MMSSNFPYSLVRPLLFSMDAESAHDFTLKNLVRAHKLGITSLFSANQGQAKEIMGIHFPNGVGLAAGLDKDGRYIDGLASLGFGFIEIGTVTPRPQAGNPKPRMFRLPQADAIINRMGFNNSGVDAFVTNVKASRFYQTQVQQKKGVLGLNIGKNADTPIEKAADDYLHCLEKVYPYASYVTVNISSPNTKNLRQLQGATELDDLLNQLKQAQKRLSDIHSRYVPIALKIAPDVDSEQIQNIAQALTKHHIDGVIATNTTITRDAVQGLAHADETGGLSGKPVFELSNQVIQQLRKALGKDFPIMGVGGIGSGQDAKTKIECGADLVQLYTGLIYRGPSLIGECVSSLAD